MDGIIVWWIFLPILAKIFFILVIVYFILLAGVQFYSTYEINLIARQARTYQKVNDRYTDTINLCINEIMENGNIVSSSLISFYHRLKNKEIAHVVWVYHICLQVKAFTKQLQLNNYTVLDKRKNILKFLHQEKTYLVVIAYKEYFGFYDTLALLGILRDKRCYEFLDYYYLKKQKHKNLYILYNLMLVYGKIGDFKAFKAIFEDVVAAKEISEESMYVRLLRNFEGDRADIDSWQRMALVSDNINIQNVAKGYFVGNSR